MELQRTRASYTLQDAFKLRMFGFPAGLMVDTISQNGKLSSRSSKDHAQRRIHDVISRSRSGQLRRRASACVVCGDCERLRKTHKTWTVEGRARKSKAILIQIERNGLHIYEFISQPAEQIIADVVLSLSNGIGVTLDEPNLSVSKPGRPSRVDVTCYLDTAVRHVCLGNCASAAGRCR